ncbi:MAG TPA: D-2-hydroxyacid dehydrogenase [Gammaproteobacteria bacterium]|nr:D-2-hydroxyacid dehydrogenase [Gammaproteobacteria bacterium]
MKTAFLDYKTVDPGDLDLSPLRKIAPNLILYDKTAADEVNKRIQDAEIIIINKTKLDATALYQAKKVKLICLVATGTDNVDLVAAKEQGVTVCNIKNYCTDSVAQHVVLSILALSHHFNEYQLSLKQGLWQKSEQFCLLEYPITELSAKTLGIVGLGVLGTAVANLAVSFGMRILVAESFRPENGMTNDAQQKPEFKRVPFQDLVSQSDVISLHCPLTPETKNLFDLKTFKSMKKNALLINTARGGLINDEALLHALEHGSIAGAALDVLDREPPAADHPLLTSGLPNLIVTPHIAWAAKEARQRALDEIAKNIACYLKGEPRNVVTA